jgi:hypothetical protein
VPSPTCYGKILDVLWEDLMAGIIPTPPVKSLASTGDYVSSLDELERHSLVAYEEALATARADPCSSTLGSIGFSVVAAHCRSRVKDRQERVADRSWLSSTWEMVSGGR